MELEVQDDNDGDLSGHGADGGGPAQEEEEGEEEREGERGRDGAAAEKAKVGALFRCVAAAVGIEAEEGEQALRQGGSSDGLEEGREQRQADAAAGVGQVRVLHPATCSSPHIAVPAESPSGQAEGAAVARQPKHDQQNQ